MSWSQTKQEGGVGGREEGSDGARDRERRRELTGAGALYRFMAFLGCLAGGAVCFFVAFLTLPILAIKPRKFAVAFTFVSPPLR